MERDIESRERERGIHTLYIYIYRERERGVGRDACARVCVCVSTRVYTACISVCMRMSVINHLLYINGLAMLLSRFFSSFFSIVRGGAYVYLRASSGVCV